jgi:PAS domain S-box-containing protein
MILNTEYKTMACNEALVSLLSLPREKILGNPCFSLVYGTNKPVGSCPFMKMMQTKKHEETEFYLDERDVWFSVSVSPTFDEMGNVIGAVHISTDITSRKQAEYTLKTSETRYRRLFETAKDGILILNARTGQIDDVNPFLIDMLGYTYEEFRGKKLWEIGAFKNLEANKTEFTELQDQGYVRYEDLPLTTKDGQEIAVEFVSNLYKVNGSKVIQCNIRNIADRRRVEDKQKVSNIYNIADRKRNKMKLKVSEDKYRNMVMNAVEGIFQTTPEGRFKTVNPAMAHMHGFASPEEMISGITDIIKQLYVNLEDRVRYQKVLDKKGIIQGFEARFYCKDGSIIWASINARAVRNPAGKILYYEGTVEDITDRKMAVENLKQHAEKLRQSLLGTIKALSMTIETRDPYTSGHQTKVSRLARAIAQDMVLSNDTVDNIRIAGSIHDIGKIAVPSEILSKPSKLTAIEFSLIKTHPQTGYDILKEAELPYPIAEIVLQHHERLNGSGYPQGLKDGQILLESQIIMVADVVEAMASHRPYRPALGIDAALEEIEKNRGILYGTGVVDACLRLFRERGFGF